jgi:4-amino-4-deoxy-L-arabinose transferase-like glycosyltransferase
MASAKTPGVSSGLSYVQTRSTERRTGTIAQAPRRFRKLRLQPLGAAEGRLQQVARAEQWVFLSGLFIVAWVVRMVALLSLRQISHVPGMQEGADGVEFEQLARALAQGRGYVRPSGMPTSFRAPGFPIFVSLIYRVTHISVSAANLSFPLLGAAICVVIYLLAKEVVPERAARLSALLGVFYFPAIYYSTVWLSEPLFMFSFALSSYLFLIYLRTGSYGVLAIAGLLFSWSVLVRPFAILMLPALLLLDFVHSRRRFLTVPVLLVCCLAPTLLWTARNYRIFHAFVLVATNGGSTFYGGNNSTVVSVPYYMGAWVSTVHLPGREQIIAAPNEYAHDKVEWQLGKQWIKSHAVEMPLLVAMKLTRFALPDFESTNTKYVVLSVVTYLPFIPLWIVGIQAVADRKNRTAPWLLIHLSIAATIATGIVFWGNPRFRDAAAPMLMLYAGCGLDNLLLKRSEKIQPQV